MWTFFKTCFNILRNISFAIVLAIVGCFAWIWTDEEARQGVSAFLDEGRETIIAEKIEDKREEQTNVQSFQYEVKDEKDERINAFNEDEETINLSEISIISIREINGDLRYVNLAEIIYFRKYGQDEYLMTTNEKVRTDISLNNVSQALKEFKSHFFFKTKNNIINCKMIKRISSKNISEDGNNYIHKVEMKNDSIINVNKNRITELKNMMKKIARPIK